MNWPEDYRNGPERSVWWVAAPLIGAVALALLALAFIHPKVRPLPSKVAFGHYTQDLGRGGGGLAPLATCAGSRKACGHSPLQPVAAGKHRPGPRPAPSTSWLSWLATGRRGDWRGK